MWRRPHKVLLNFIVVYVFKPEAIKSYDIKNEVVKRVTINHLSITYLSITFVHDLINNIFVI